MVGWVGLDERSRQVLRSLVALLCRDDRLVWDWGVSFDVLRIAVIKGARWASNLMSSRQSETTRDLEIFRCAQYDRGERSI